tara:strand:- start:158 stop:895 length:738 start_codon:yes stop_codon:yes gene_type:complete
MKIIGMVPARLESTRLKEKALIDIDGLPMVVHTCKRAELALKLDEVYLVTDSKLIRDVAERHNINYIMTGEHVSSSDRLAEASNYKSCDIIVNIQGDEPLVNPNHIDKILEPIINDSNIDIVFGITPFYKKNSYSDIKVVKDNNDYVLYMSRNDIPCYYNNQKNNEMFKLCTIVPYKKELLLKFTKWDQSKIELIEDNHFLRFLENGIKIKAVEIEDGKISVDTMEDLKEVSEMMKNDTIKLAYV